MAVTPLKEIKDTFDTNKQLSIPEMLRNPAVPPDYAMNLGFAAMRDFNRRLNEEVSGLYWRSGFWVGGGATNLVFDIFGGVFFYKNFHVFDTSVVNMNISVDFPNGSGNTGILYAKITEKRFISSDAADPDFGGIDPVVDLTYTTTSVLDTHNEWRWRLEWFVNNTGVLPSDVESATDENQFFIKWADLTEIGAGNIQVDYVNHLRNRTMETDQHPTTSLFPYVQRPLASPTANQTHPDRPVNDYEDVMEAWHRNKGANPITALISGQSHVLLQDEYANEYTVGSPLMGQQIYGIFQDSLGNVEVTDGALILLRFNSVTDVSALLSVPNGGKFSMPTGLLDPVTNNYQLPVGLHEILFQADGGVGIFKLLSNNYQMFSAYQMERPWNIHPHNAGDWATLGGGSLSGTGSTVRYQVFGKRMHIQITFSGTISGSPTSSITFAIPGGFTHNVTGDSNIVMRLRNVNDINDLGMCRVVASGSVFTFSLLPGGTTMGDGLTQIQADVTIELS